MKIDVQMIGLPDFAERLERFPRATQKAATLAINATARKARTQASIEIRKQVNLTRAYLNTDKRLWISRFAKETNLTAKITARHRPTQLTTYGARQLTRKGKHVARRNAGVSVKVKRGGKQRKLRTAFFLKLKNGNLGIAVRSIEGLNLKKAGLASSKQSAGVHVLYGPSIDQVFNDVRHQIGPDMAKFLGQEFNRQYARVL